MSEPDPVRMRYLADAVATATPAQRIVMLYDRLLTDIERALGEIETGSNAGASTHLRHAQLIVAELWGSLDPSAWDGADDLASLYGFLVREFVEADRAADATKLVACRRIVRALRTSWSEAGNQLAVDSSSAALPPTSLSAPISAASASRGATVATHAAFIPAVIDRPVSAGSWIS